MDERQKMDEQVEDLEMQQNDAEDVKGGLHVGGLQAGMADGSVRHLRPGVPRPEEEMQHNETLIRI